MLKKAGHRVIHLPVIDITPIAFSSPKLSEITHLIFLSANAVSCFFSQISTIDFRNQAIIAIGPATQQAIEKYGISNAIIPNQFSSQGILDLDCFSDPSQHTILIISGENAKPLLAKTLALRGARVIKLSCYQRTCIKYDMDTTLPQLEKTGVDTLISTSHDSLNCLFQLFSNVNQRQWLLTKTLCVISQEMTDFAKSIGFHQIIQADNATTEAIVAACS